MDLLLFSKEGWNYQSKSNAKTFTMGSRVIFKEVIKFYYDQTNIMIGTDYKVPD